MTYNEIINIAKRLDKEVQQRIDKDVEERLEILRQGELDQEDMEKMEECLYMSLVLQEYLSGEYELLDEERQLLLDEMEEMYNEYGELLTKAKLEEKVSKKKRMALYLMKIREQLFENKKRVNNVKERMKENKNSQDKLKELSSKENMKEIAKENKREKLMDRDRSELPNPDRMKWGRDSDSGREKTKEKPNKKTPVNPSKENYTPPSEGQQTGSEKASIKKKLLDKTEEDTKKTTDGIPRPDAFGFGVYKGMPHDEKMAQQALTNANSSPHS